MRDLTLNGEFPKACFSSLHLQSVDEVYEHFSRIIRKHELRSYDSQYARSELHYAPLSSMAISSARVGTNMRVEAEALEDSCLLFCARDEPFYMRIDNQTVHVNHNTVAVIMPGVPFSLQVAANAGSIMLDINLDYLESLIAAETGSPMKGALEFSARTTAQSKDSDLIALLKLLYEQVARGASTLAHAPCQRSFENLIANTLIFGRQHNYSAALDNASLEVAPRYVQRAIDYMHAHLRETISLSTLAQAVATSERSLARGFKKYRKDSPMNYLSKLRLQHAREDLQRGYEAGSVTAIANKWGFFNSGRFAAAYRRQYGENPLTTLKRKGPLS